MKVDLNINILKILIFRIHTREKQINLKVTGSSFAVS